MLADTGLTDFLAQRPTPVSAGALIDDTLALAPEHPPRHRTRRRGIAGPVRPHRGRRSRRHHHHRSQRRRPDRTRPRLRRAGDPTPMTDAFHIDVPHTDGALAVIALAGEFDIAAAPAVRARALDLIANGHPAWSPTSRASPSATPPAWAPSSASGATPWTPTPPSPWRPSGAASALGYLPSARATAPPPETSPSPGRHPTAGQQCTARPFPPAAHRAGPSAPRPTNWSRRALHPIHQALHGERRRAAHGMLSFPPGRCDPLRCLRPWKRSVPRPQRRGSSRTRSPRRPTAPAPRDPLHRTGRCRRLRLVRQDDHQAHRPQESGPHRVR